MQKYGQGNAYSLAYWMLDDDQRGLTRCDYSRVGLAEALNLAPADSNILLSTEWFTELRKPAVEAILAEAEKSRLDVFVIYFYRDAINWNLSEYKQALKFGRLKEPKDFKPRNPFDSVEIYESVFDKERVTGIALSREISVYSEILSYLQVTGAICDYPTESANRSLSDVSLFLQLQATVLEYPLSQRFLIDFNRFLESRNLDEVRLDIISSLPGRFDQSIENLSKGTLPASVSHKRAFPENAFLALIDGGEKPVDNLSWEVLRPIAEAFREFSKTKEFAREARDDLVYIFNKALVEM